MGLFEGLKTHLAQPEGFIMLGSYLTGTWMFGLMPASYYSFDGGINWFQVLQQLLIQDLVQYLMHLVEHEVKTQSVIHFPALQALMGDNKSSTDSTTKASTTGKSALVIKWPFNLYTVSHKPHHRFTNPRMFDAYNGSPADTFLMILGPLLQEDRLGNLLRPPRAPQALQLQLRPHLYVLGPHFWHIQRPHHCIGVQSGHLIVQ